MARQVTLNIPFKVAICRLAGLDPETVTRIHFTLLPNAAPLMAVERIVPDDEQNAWQEVLEECTLVHRKLVREEFFVQEGSDAKQEG